jgi:hypothetical protein
VHCSLMTTQGGRNVLLALALVGLASGTPQAVHTHLAKDTSSSKAPAAPLARTVLRKATNVIRYWSNEADEFYPLTFEIDDAANAKVVVATNRGAPQESHGVGVFAKSLAAFEVDPLHAAVADQAFAAVVNPSGLVPGTSIRKIGVYGPGGTLIERIAGGDKPTSPAFTNPEKVVLARVAEVVRHPVLAVSLALDSVIVVQGAKPGQSLEVVLQLALVVSGTQRLHLPPLGQWIDVPNLMVEFLRNDLPVAELRGEHHLQVAVRPNQAKVVAPMGAGIASELILGAATPLRLTAELPVALPAGSYSVQISLQFQLRSNEPSIVQNCEVLSQRRTVHVPTSGVR